MRPNEVDESGGGWLTTEVRTLDPLIRHLRAHVAELRRLEAEAAEPAELAEHKRLIVLLQDKFAYAVRDLIATPTDPLVRRPAADRMRRP